MHGLSRANVQRPNEHRLLNSPGPNYIANTRQREYFSQFSFSLSSFLSFFLSLVIIIIIHCRCRCGCTAAPLHRDVVDVSSGSRWVVQNSGVVQRRRSYSHSRTADLRTYTLSQTHTQRNIESIKLCNKDVTQVLAIGVPSFVNIWDQRGPAKRRRRRKTASVRTTTVVPSCVPETYF